MAKEEPFAFRGTSSAWQIGLVRRRPGQVPADEVWRATRARCGSGTDNTRDPGAGRAELRGKHSLASSGRGTWRGRHRGRDPTSMINSSGPRQPRLRAQRRRPDHAATPGKPVAPSCAAPCSRRWARAPKSRDRPRGTKTRRRSKAARLSHREGHIPEPARRVGDGQPLRPDTAGKLPAVLVVHGHWAGGAARSGGAGALPGPGEARLLRAGRRCLRRRRAFHEPGAGHLSRRSLRQHALADRADAARHAGLRQPPGRRLLCSRGPRWTATSSASPAPPAAATRPCTPAPSTNASAPSCRSARSAPTRRICRRPAASARCCRGA